VVDVDFVSVSLKLLMAGTQHACGCVGKHTMNVHGPFPKIVDACIPDGQCA
jgi:hypothetical protein